MTLRPWRLFLVGALVLAGNVGVFAVLVWIVRAG